MLNWMTILATQSIDAPYSQQLEQIAGNRTAQIPTSGETTSNFYNYDNVMYVIAYTNG